MPIDIVVRINVLALTSFYLLKYFNWKSNFSLNHGACKHILMKYPDNIIPTLGQNSFVKS